MPNFIPQYDAGRVSPAPVTISEERKQRIAMAIRSNVLEPPTVYWVEERPPLFHETEKRWAFYHPSTNRYIVSNLTPEVFYGACREDLQEYFAGCYEFRSFFGKGSYIENLAPGEKREFELQYQDFCQSQEYTEEVESFSRLNLRGRM